MNIQWYPGHMTKTRRMILENITLVDIVIELVDARLPFSSKNPDIDELAKNKFRIMVLNKADLADEKSNALWSDYFRQMGFQVILADSVAGKGLNEVTTTARELMKEKMEKQKARGRLFMPIRSMIVGIPNVGKSTFINKYVGKAMTKTGDKPGVTRGKQWIKIKKDFELLDTPGILWPKFEDQQAGMKLAFTGAINDDVIDQQTLAVEFIQLLMLLSPDVLKTRYNIIFDTIEEPWRVLEKIAVARGFKMKGNEADLARAAKILLDEYRGGKLGRMTLELPQDIEESKLRLKEEEKRKKADTAKRKQDYKQRS